MDRKNAHSSFIAPEDIKTDVWYALTLNPNSTMQFTKAKGGLRNTLFYTNFLQWYKKWFGKYKYVMCMEKSKTGRLHWHGKIKFTIFDDIDRFYDLLHRLEALSLMTFKFGDISEEKFSDKFETWEQYYTKQNAYFDALNQAHTVSNKSADKAQDNAQNYNIIRYFS